MNVRWQGAHAGAYGLVRMRIAAGAHQDYAGRSDGVGGANDGAEVAGVADGLQRQPQCVLREPLVRPK